MPRYSYIAKTRNGISKRGTLDVKDKHELAKILREEGSILIRAKLSEGKKGKAFSFSFSLWHRVSLVDKTMFTRNLRVMIMAGISIPRSLGILTKQIKSQKFKKAILKIKEDITKGESFSTALSQHPSIFAEVFVNMVKVGEESGTLEKALDVLTLQMEKEHEIKSKVKGAMIYPAVIISAMVGIGIIMLIVVVPKLSTLFDQLNIELPLSTRVVIMVGNFLSRFWYTIPIIFVFLGISFKAVLKTKLGKSIFDRAVLKIPLISPIIKKTYAAHTVRTLSSLISAGVPIVRSLEIVSNALGNVHYKKAIAEAAEEVKKGGKLAEALEKYDDIYPILVIQMIAVGEETGETSSILEKLADFFEEEVSNATDNISSIIEPILMLIIGVMVGFFAISMIQPMYSVMEGM